MEFGMYSEFMVWWYQTCHHGDENCLHYTVTWRTNTHVMQSQG